jgi:hypothetical protein
MVTTVGMDEEKIRRYVKYQEDADRQDENHERQDGPFKGASSSHRLWWWLLTIFL